MDKIAFFYELGYTMAKEAAEDSDRIAKRTALSALAGGIGGGIIGHTRNIPLNQIIESKEMPNVIKDLVYDVEIKADRKRVPPTEAEMQADFLKEWNKTMNRLKSSKRGIPTAAKAEAALNKLRLKNLAKGGLIGAALLGGLSLPYHYYRVKKEYENLPFYKKWFR